MSRVRYEVIDQIAEIMLDEPPVNALDTAMVTALVAALGRAAVDPEVRAVILGSRLGGCFCAGLNLSLLDGASAARIHELLDLLYVQMTEAQFRLGKPSIAAVTGAARGGGVTLAIGCDLIVAGRGASFAYPEIEVGLLPAIHFAHLPRIVGRHRAFELLFGARIFDAAEARSLGLVSQVVDDDAVLDEARAVARNLARHDPLIMRLGRTAFHNAVDTDYRRSVAGAVANFCTVAATEPSRAAVSAFVAARGRRR